MINYHIRKKKRTRYTFRLVGFAITVICFSQVIAFILGYGRNHKIGTFFAFIFGMYGIYLFINSFKSRFYNTDYEFKENDFTVKARGTERTFAYSDITDLNMIVPQNELIYSIIQIVVGKEQFLLPFTLKKDVADQIYTLLCKKTNRVPINVTAAEGEAVSENVSSADDASADDSTASEEGDE